VWPPNRELETWLRDELEDWLGANGVPCPLDEVRGDLTLGLDEDHLQYVLFEPKPPWKNMTVVKVKTPTAICISSARSSTSQRSWSTS